MASGVFRKGVHYFSPKGLGSRFKWSAVVAWLEQVDTCLKVLDTYVLDPDFEAAQTFVMEALQCA